MPDLASEIKVWPVPEAQGRKPRYDYHRKESYYTKQRNQEHRAPCDIFARQGADVLSMTDGVVWSTKVGGDWGKQVRVETSLGMTVLYAHLSKQLAEVGRKVEAGQKIGEVGHTGFTKGRTGDHLHPEFWSDRNWLHTIDLSQRLESVRLGGNTPPEEEEDMGGEYADSRTDEVVQLLQGINAEIEVIGNRAQNVEAWIAESNLKANLEAILRESGSASGDLSTEDRKRIDGLLAELKLLGKDRS